MKISRGGILAALAVVLLGLVIARWVSGWGLITLSVKDAPLSKVLRSIEKQGGVRIVTNADPSTPLTLYLKKVPLTEALGTVAARLDGTSRLGYVAAPTRPQQEELLTAFSNNMEPKGWRIFLYSGFGGGGGGQGGGGPGGGGFGMAGGNEDPENPLKVSWTISDMPEKTVQAYLDQGAQKTGILFAAPEFWNPPVGKLPDKDTVRDMATKVVKSGGGKIREVYFVMTRPRGRDRNAQGGNYPIPQAPPVAGFFPQRNPNANRDWAMERVQSQIDSLPPQEREMAMKLRDEFRALRNLPPEERRQKMEELFQRPDVVEMMESRASASDARRSPEQRAQRYERYIQRKNQVRNPRS